MTKWNLESIFTDIAAFEAEYKAISDLLFKAEEWKTKNLESSAEVEALLKDFFALSRRVSKMFTYAHMVHDGDTSSDLGKQLFQRAHLLYQNFDEATSWIRPSLLRLPEKSFLENMKGEYSEFFRKLLQVKEHILSEEMEALLAKEGGVGSCCARAFQALNNGDVAFGEVLDGKGNAFPLSHATYIDALTSKDRVLRRLAFLQMHDFYARHKNVFGELLTGSCLQMEFVGTSRGFKDPLCAALKENAIAPSVVRTLIEVTKKGLPALHSYIDLRKKRLELDKVHAYDLMAPLAKDHKDRTLTFEEGCHIILEALAPLGKEYVSILQKGLFEEGWVDSEVRDKKRSGAYSGGSYDTHPFILISWTGKVHSLFTLAHEIGHSMHSYYSRKNQPYHLAEYSIFVAEVASICNEFLLADYLLKVRPDLYSKEEVVEHMIDGIRATYFRQTCFAEFELAMHEKIWEKEPVTVLWMKEFYLSLCATYYGKDFSVDDLLGYEVLRIPHFYTPFYVYQYATGMSAASAFFSKIRKDPAAVQGYLHFLSSGDAKFPVQLLKESGIDIEQTYQDTIDLFTNLVKELANG